MSLSRQRRNASLIYNSVSPLLSGEDVESKNAKSAFFGVTDTKMRNSDLTDLLESMRCDDEELFTKFSYEEIEDIRMSVTLSQLAVSEFLMIYFVHLKVS